MCDEELADGCPDGGAERNDEKRLTLLDLPVEIFLHICSFLDASTLVHGLSLTCTQFHEILNDVSIWKVRISQICANASFPILPCGDENELFWKLSCTAIERQAKLWRNKDSLDMIRLHNVHYSTIDALLLMNKGNICISGGRDRSLVLWQLSSEDCDKYDSICLPNAHEGWIWDLAAIRNTIYSCSWDSTVKSWSMTNTGLIPLTTYNETSINSALLCVTASPELELFATGSFCKNVLVYDSRSGYSPIIKYEPHQRAVIRLAMNSNYILSASEDKTVNVWDQRAGRIMKSITISKESFPMSMCLKDDIVFVGDSAAKLHILNPKEDFKLVKSYKTGHRKSITGVHVDYGCLITSSLDKTIQVSTVTDPPQSLTSLQYCNGEVASIDYLNEVLAVSDPDAIQIWRPKARGQ